MAATVTISTQTFELWGATMGRDLKNAIDNGDGTTTVPLPAMFIQGLQNISPNMDIAMQKAISNKQAQLAETIPPGPIVPSTPIVTPPV